MRWRKRLLSLVSYAGAIWCTASILVLVRLLAVGSRWDDAISVVASFGFTEVGVQVGWVTLATLRCLLFVAGSALVIAMFAGVVAILVYAFRIVFGRPV